MTGPIFVHHRRHDRPLPFPRLRRRAAVRHRPCRCSISTSPAHADLAGHAGCAPADLTARFVVNDSFRHHETAGSMMPRSSRPCATRSASAFRMRSFWKDGTRSSPVKCLISRRCCRARLTRLPLYAFSNTNPAHVTHFTKTYADLLGHFREIYLSSSIGLRKPAAEAYHHVVSAIGVPASRIVFFDDSADNIAGARGIWPYRRSRQIIRRCCERACRARNLRQEYRLGLDARD